MALPRSLWRPIPLDKISAAAAWQPQVDPDELKRSRFLIHETIAIARKDVARTSQGRANRGAHADAARGLHSATLRRRVHLPAAPPSHARKIIQNRSGRNG